MSYTVFSRGYCRYLSLLSDARTHRHPPQAEWSEGWPQALALLEMVEGKKLHLQQITYNAAIRALELYTANF